MMTPAGLQDEIVSEFQTLGGD
ncbi:MAG: hypothetical protein RL161_884, partial [Bacteroidota bacterium]